MAVRKIIKIHEERCNGCGECIPQCEEGALQIVDGKVRLVDDRYCDGLGACLGHCPQDAIEIIERDASKFDEAAVEEHQRHLEYDEEKPAHACPGAAMFAFSATPEDETVDAGTRPSALTQWPVQLHLVPVSAPYLQGAELLLAADCVPFAMANFHGELLAGRKVLIGCPKLDDTSAYEEKLAAILRQNDVRGLTVAHMEVPCCYGLVVVARRAIERSGKQVPLKEVTVSVQGGIRDETGVV
ncbi:MAG: 4Fe-4S binding protein [Candidatus Brocadiia bacterium]|nr:4Fe-4S binding protein [Candidatus Brocadiia bacterium]